MISILDAAVYRVYEPREFEEVYFDMTRNEVIKHMKLVYRQRGYSLPKDNVDDELVMDFCSLHWPEPLKEINGVLINIYTNEPSMANVAVKGKKPKKVKSPLVYDTVED